MSAKTGTAILRGHVVTADSGQPLRKVQVRLASAEIRDGRTTTTDDKGAYEFTELPAGRYIVSASKGGYVQLQYGQLRAFEAGRPVDVRDGQTTEKIDFSLPRGGVITGRIIDEIGEPITDASVSAMRYQYVQGKRRLVSAGRASTTNDIGEFRIYGLLPGQYYVSAGARDIVAQTMSISLSGGLASDDGRQGYAPTYYPGTTHILEAQKVTIAVAQTVADVQIQLQTIRTARVSGSVSRTDGRTVTQGTVVATVKEDPLAAPSVSMIRPDGTFTLSGLPPGDYTLVSAAGDVFGGGLEMAIAEITLTGDDLAGVRLMGLKPVTVKGRIVTAPEAERALPAMAAINLTIIAANPDEAYVGSATPGRIADDRTFEVQVLPGKGLFRLGGAVGQFAIRAVRYRGSDFADTPFEFKANEDVTDVEIELTNQMTQLTGAVTDSKGQPSKDFVVVVFSQDRERWTATTRHINVGRPDQEGRFRARVPAGQFLAVALDYLEPGEQYDREFLEKLRDAAAPFALSAGQTQTLTLKVTPHP